MSCFVMFNFLKIVSDCHYTCHYKCRLLVTLDCRSVSDSLKSSSTKSTELPVFDDEESILADDVILSCIKFFAIF